MAIIKDPERALFEEYFAERWPNARMDIRTDGLYWENHDDDWELWKAARAKLTDEQTLVVLRKLDPNERVWLFSHFCRHCGTENTKCRCWDDS